MPLHPFPPLFLQHFYPLLDLPTPIPLLGTVLLYCHEEVEHAVFEVGRSHCHHTAQGLLLYPDVVAQLVVSLLKLAAFLEVLSQGLVLIEEVGVPVEEKSQLADRPRELSLNHRKTALVLVDTIERSPSFGQSLIFFFELLNERTQFLHFVGDLPTVMTLT